MKGLTGSFTINQQRVKTLERAKIKALEMTAEALKGEIQNDEVIPMQSGNLKNESFFIDDSQSKEGKVSLVHSTPYARRLYYHPEYHFSHEKDAHAKGEWFDDYLPGGKKENYAKNAFKELYRRCAGT